MLSLVKSAKNRAKDFTFGNDVQDLKWFFQEFESQIGLRSVQGSFESQCHGLNPGGSNPEDHDPHAARLDRESIMSHKKSRGRRIWHALRWLDQQHDATTLVILHRLYGAVRVSSDMWNVFGEDAALASMTDTAERLREEMAQTRGEEREETVLSHYDDEQESNRDRYCEEFWSAVVDECKTRKEIADLLYQLEIGRLNGFFTALQVKNRKEKIDYLCRLADGWREMQRKTLDAYKYNRRLDTRMACYAGADRETTVDDALEHLILCANSVRESNVAAVKRDVAVLKLKAHAAYQRAKSKTVNT